MANNKTVIFIAAAIAVGLIIYSGNVSGNPVTGNTVSSQQLQQTANFEGFSGTAYPDGTRNGVQLYSIGYGHQIQPGESNLMTDSIDESTGLQLLASDMQNVINAINATGINFTSGQFDALADFGYNEGVGNLAKIISVYNASGASAVPAALKQYVYWHPVAGGAAVVNNDLVARRSANINTWNS